MTSRICKTVTIVNKTNTKLFHVFELVSLKLVNIRFGTVKEYDLSFPANMITLLN